MAPPRRPNFTRPRTRSQYTPSPVSSAPVKQDPMPPTSRYLHNLKVIQRHDPSITSLFDQFPHVCVYHHKGDEWRKKGCEGAMFLFERSVETIRRNRGVADGMGLAGRRNPNMGFTS